MGLYENDDVSKRYADELDYQLIPLDGSTVQDVVDALDNSDFYGSYVSNMRNKKEIEAALIKHFGPNLPTHKRPLEKKQGFPFPVKSKTAIDDFIKQFNSKPNLLTYEVGSDSIIFPTSKNTSKQNTKKLLQTVLGNANINYKLKETESLGEIRKNIREALELKKLSGFK